MLRSYPKIVGFCGSPWRPSKARALVEGVAAELSRLHGIDTQVLDLVDAGPQISAYDRNMLDDRSLAIVEKIEEADGLIIGTPVFQGSYSGLFKHVFDLVEPGKLKNRAVLMTACGGGLRHSLVVEHQLRPLFGFFEARTISTSVYAGASEFTDGQMTSEVVQARIRNAVDQFASCFPNLAAA